MAELASIVLISWLAGITAFVGGVVALLEGSEETVAKREMIHGIVAFGGGILVAAVAFALAPEAIAALPPVPLAATFCLGGVVFCALDAWMSRRSGSKAQFMALLMDFEPEAITLGALFGHNHRTGALLALFIGAQNLPEGFNACREITAGGDRPRNTLALLFAISLLGPAAAGCGYLLLQDLSVLTAGIMSFAAGASCASCSRTSPRSPGCSSTGRRPWARCRISRSA